jgi:transposase InsO family protein
MREDNLLCVRRRKFVVTTNSNHGLNVYPNLARGIVLTSMDQLWRADITYIRLREEFVFLAVILDAYSRRVIGWALDRTLEDSLTLAALRMALARRVIQPGLIHHSDRGSQYASNDYTDLLKDNGIAISMSRKGNPWDNAACESFMKTLKYEEVHRSEYRDLAEARASIAEFLDKVYNQQRLHSALGYVPPAEFEASLAQKNKEAARRHCLKMSFLRHARSIGPMGQVKTILRLEPCRASRWSAPGFAAGRGCITAPSLIVRDEYAPAIPWRVALQQWNTRPEVWTIRQGTRARLKMPGRRQLRPRAHWCLANPTCSVALDPVLNTVMTPVVQRLREISFGRLLDLHGPGQRAG